MINRGETTQSVPLNLVGSSTFGRYPKISQEKTYNLFVSDNFMVPYAGYEIAILSSMFGNGIEGRGIHTSTKLGRLIVVIDNRVYLTNISFDQQQLKPIFTQVIQIGTLQTSHGVVYITENNKPQILISDNTSLYVYDPTLTPTFQIPSISFIPGYIDFHDTYFLCAARADGVYTPPANNTWRLSASNDGMSWPNGSSSIGLLQTKPDNTKAILRMPGKGNMILVLGSIVTEPWFDVGYQLFPYQRNTSYNIDYGCLSPASVVAMDDIAVWLGINEKSGPVVMYTEGGAVQKVTTDGFDFLLANLQNPSDSQGFIYRQDGHVFYHINFYTDNLSFFIDFLPDGSKKIYHACDDNNNYFIAASVAFFNNQYYFISKNNGNLYAFDTVFTTYSGREIPRIRICKNIRNKKQDYFIVNDCGFTIDSGNTNYYVQDLGPIYLITQDGKKLITEGAQKLFITQDNEYLITQDDKNLISQQIDPTEFSYLISQQSDISSNLNQVPRVDLSISIDGGEHFSSYDAQYLPPIGQRKNKLMWWQLGAANDFVPQFRFWNFGRFTCTDGEVNIRQ